MLGRYGFIYYNKIWKKYQFDFISHSSSAVFRASMPVYPFTLLSRAMRLPSSIAAAVVSLDTSSFNAKGIPCSRIVVLRNILIAVVMFSPSSAKICQHPFRFCHAVAAVTRFLSGWPSSLPCPYPVRLLQRRFL